MKEMMEAQNSGTDDVKNETIDNMEQKDMSEKMEDNFADINSADEEDVSDAALKAEAADDSVTDDAAADGDVASADNAESDDAISADDAMSDNDAANDDAMSDENAVSDDDAMNDENAASDGDMDSAGSLDRVWKAIRMYRRDEVSTLMREHAIDIATDEQKIEIGKGIMGLRDIKLVEQFAKEQEIFTPDMLRLDFENWNNRDFVRQVLSRCKKNFDLSDEEVCRELFEISCEVGQTEVLSFLVNKKKATDCYPMLAKGTEEAFAVLKQVKPASLDANMRVEIMYAAATTTQGQERLEKLSAFGYDLFEENSEGQTLSSLLNERIVSNTYTKNRAGDMNRMKDKAVVQFIERKKNPVDSKAGHRKFSIKKALPFLIIGLIFVCVLVYAVMYQIFS